jgi:hypothetical protein
MRIQVFLLAYAAAFVPLHGANAANESILMTNNAALNDAAVEIDGDFNRLVIAQDHAGGSAGNSISVNIKGDFNGGPTRAGFTGAALLPGLAPGSLTQHGYGNSMSFDVSGSNNLFAAAQTGSYNTIMASISGSANQASIAQTGNSNFVAFSQNGIGNTVSVTQTSW